MLRSVIDATEAIRAEVDIEVAASLLMLKDGQAERLAAAGVHRYNTISRPARAFSPRFARPTRSMTASIPVGASLPQVWSYAAAVSLAWVKPGTTGSISHSCSVTWERVRSVQLPQPTSWDPARDHALAPAARGTPLRRRVPVRQPRSGDPLCGRARADALGSASVWNARRRERADRRQLPHHSRTKRRGGSCDAVRLGHAGGEPATDGSMARPASPSVGWRPDTTRVPPWAIARLIPVSSGVAQEFAAVQTTKPRAEN
jgi:hypothetical protein